MLIEWISGRQSLSLSDKDDENREIITCFCLHPSENQIVVATQNNLLRHVDLDSKSCIRAIKFPKMPILCMNYDNSGSLVATGSSDGSVRVWDIAKGYCTHSFKDHLDVVVLVKFHPNPNQLQVFSTSEDSTIRIYDLIDSKCIMTFRDHMSVPTDISFSCDGYMMASSGRDKVSFRVLHPLLVGRNTLFPSIYIYIVASMDTQSWR